MIEITAVGGYDEVGKNCTAINIDGVVILCDLGIHLENYIKYTESDEEDIMKLSGTSLMKAGAVPDLSSIDDIKKKVKAIIPTHAHLDHLGAIPYLANRFDCDIYGTPYTTSVLNAILKDEGISMKNAIKTANINSKFSITKDIEVEFVNMTHSTVQTVMLAIHTKYGIIIYANDFKFDNYPVIGKKPSFDKLRELGSKNVIALICDSTYALDSRKTPSESVAREMLKDVLLGTDSTDKLIVVTTFSSHIARLKSIVEIGEKLNRKIVFLGRSLAKYVKAAQEVGIIDLSKKVEIVKYSKAVKKYLKRIKTSQRSNYILVVTGHQGEPKAVLSKIANDEMDLKLRPEDHVIFSCKTIPTPTNIENRAILEKRLRKIGVRVFKDIHVSGHAGREDLRDLINIVKPKKVIPAHGYLEMRKGMEDLALEIGYEKKDILLLNDGNRVKIV